MPQLVFKFTDEAEDQIRNNFGFAPSPAEVAILRAVELEDELARATTPEARQRINARFADQERRAVRESRRGG